MRLPRFARNRGLPQRFALRNDTTITQDSVLILGNNCQSRADRLKRRGKQDRYLYSKGMRHDAT